MINTGKLAGQTLFITGASRGIGKAIALKAAKDGANVVIAAKTTEAHPKLPGTIYTAAKEVEEAGGKCLPCVVDIRDEEQVQKAVDSAVAKFGCIDILVNNASAIHLTGTVDTPMKKYDLMQNVNARGTFLTSKICIPHLKNSKKAHILNISPPLLMESRWFKDHVAYTMAKFGMSMCVLGMAEELKCHSISVNALWPKTAISTSAMELLGGRDILKNCRKPEIVADAAYAIFSDDKPPTGQFLIDEHVLKGKGITDFSEYAIDPTQSLTPDFFLPEEVLHTFTDGIKAFSTPNSSSAGASENQIELIFTKVKPNLNEEIAALASGIYCFRVQGDAEEVWYLDLSSGAGSVGRGEHPTKKPDVTFILDLSTFINIFSGALKPTNAFLSGKLKLKGNMGLAMKLEKVMVQLNSKL